MIGSRTWSTRRKPAPVPLCPPQTPHAARTRTRAAAVGSRRLTAWATARTTLRWRNLLLCSNALLLSFCVIASDNSRLRGLSCRCHARICFTVLLVCWFSFASVWGCLECFFRSGSLLLGGRRSIASTGDYLNESTIFPIEVTFADACNYLPVSGSDGRILEPVKLVPTLLACTVAGVAPRVTSCCVYCSCFTIKTTLT
jgi:hypothetical protein